MIQVLQKFSEPWGIREDNVSQKKRSQRQEKQNKIDHDDADGQKDAIRRTHDFLHGLSE
jgi:hypothetical protein